ncbi:MAG: hybrid sensor histidine kinase/response regulator, partial [Gammaproteobacteria bacterium]|nr:hybrid sensor histidine kinase/response regulator [Gammaproteobacteria bacterium]
PSPPPLAAVSRQDPPSPAATAPQPPPPEVVAAPREPSLRLDSMRVDPQKLDSLMVHAGELKVTRNRLSCQLAELDQALSQWEQFYAEGLQKRGEGSEQQWKQLGLRLNQTLADLRGIDSRLEVLSGEIASRVSEVRMIPLSTLFNLFPRMVRDLAQDLGKEVELQLEGGETTVDKQIVEEMKDPLTHLLRNALHHGIESPQQRQKLAKSEVGRITLRGYREGGRLVISLSDDGAGINCDKIRARALKQHLATREQLEGMTPRQLQEMIFIPGFSTQEMVTDISGRGVGMDVVCHNVERIKGKLELESQPGEGMVIRASFPLTLATTHVILVRLQQQIFALPVESIETSIRLDRGALFHLEGHETLLVGGEPTSVAALADLLRLPLEDAVAANSGDSTYCIILSVGEERLGILVDELIDEQQVVVKPAGALLKRISNISGSTILSDGRLAMVLNPQDLLKSIQRQQLTRHSLTDGDPQLQQKQLLLVEDSVITRLQEQRILESAGYRVTVAVDGLDGWQKLQQGHFDAVVSDINMPNLDGFELCSRIRQQAAYEDLPLILVTTLSSVEDKQRGLEVGANAYITKGTFERSALIDTLHRLIGGVEA